MFNIKCFTILYMYHLSRKHWIWLISPVSYLDWLRNNRWHQNHIQGSFLELKNCIRLGTYYLRLTYSKYKCWKIVSITCVIFKKVQDTKINRKESKDISVLFLIMNICNMPSQNSFWWKKAFTNVTFEWYFTFMDWGDMKF